MSYYDSSERRIGLGYKAFFFLIEVANRIDEMGDFFFLELVFSTFDLDVRVRGIHAPFGPEVPSLSL